MKNKLLALLFALAGLMTGEQASAQWTVFNTGSYKFTDLVWVDSVTAYATEGKMILYKTSDHGKSWKEIDIAPKLPYGKVSFPSLAVGYATTGGNQVIDSAKQGIYRTIDSGNTWTKINSTLGGQDIHFFTPAVGFFIESEIEHYPQYFYSSQDSGNTWSRTNQSGQYKNWSVSPSGRLYITGVYDWYDFNRDLHHVSTLDYSDDFGYTWIYAALDSQSTFVKVSYPDSNFGFLLKWEGMQVNLTNLYDGTANANNWNLLPQNDTFLIGDFIFLSKQEGYCFGGYYHSHDGIWHTNDGGKTWIQEYQRKPSDNFAFFTLAPDKNLYAIGGIYGHGLILYKKDVTAIQQPLHVEMKISIFPNPFIDKIQIELNSLSDKISKVCVYDIVGKLKFQEKAEGNAVQIQRRNLASGEYILLIEDNHGNRSHYKIIAQ